MIRLFLVIGLLLLLTGARSFTAKAHFALTNPCPSTGESTPHCPGYVIDHIWPLCAGGKDVPQNMQWQTTAESYKKDYLERKLCAAMKKAPI